MLSVFVMMVTMSSASSPRLDLPCVIMASRLDPTLKTRVTRLIISLESEFLARIASWLRL